MLLRIIRAFSYAGIIKRNRFSFQVSKRTVGWLARNRGLALMIEPVLRSTAFAKKKTPRDVKEARF